MSMESTAHVTNHTAPRSYQPDKALEQPIKGSAEAPAQR